MKLPISYYGGKQRQAHNILPLIPEHRIYVEPYAGGAAIFFAKGPKDTKGYIEVLNDRDERLVNFYKVLQNPIMAWSLYSRLDVAPYSRKIHAEAKFFNKSPDFSDPVNAAYHYFIDVVWSFSNVVGRGWSMTVAKSAHRPKTSMGKVEALQSFVERMRGVYIENLDALEIISRWDSPETFFYLDPPYPGANQGHYGGFTSEDFACLVEKLKKVKGKILLSNYDQPGIPKRWKRHEFKALASAAKNRPMERIEVVWSNY